MSDNHEVEQGNEPSSDPVEDLFLSPDDSGAEEIRFEAGNADSPDDATPDATPEPALASEPAPAPPQPAAVDTVDSAALREVEAERDEYRNRMMRVAADLENFRKRTSREKEDMRKYGIDRMVLELLPVIDNLERALEHADKSEDSTTIVDGVRMVNRQFITALEKHGVKGFESKGEQFDPQKHEAIQQVDTTDHPTGYVLEQYQKGYYLHERLIRPALVVVVRNPEGVVAAEAATQHDEGASQPSAQAGEEVKIEVESGDAESDASDESAVKN